MIIAVDFDNTVVIQDGRDYEDLETPLQMLPGARDGLLSLKDSGHILLLYSARANRALRIDPTLDPLVRAGVKKVWRNWEENCILNEKRYQQMIDFVNAELPDVFDAIDDGGQGKPSADIYLDDKALRLGHGANAVNWRGVMLMYGESVYGGSNGQEQRQEV